MHTILVFILDLVFIVLITIYFLFNFLMVKNFIQDFFYLLYGHFSLMIKVAGFEDLSDLIFIFILFILLFNIKLLGLELSIFFSFLLLGYLGLWVNKVNLGFT